MGMGNQAEFTLPGLIHPKIQIRQIDSASELCLHYTPPISDSSEHPIRISEDNSAEYIMVFLVSNPSHVSQILVSSGQL